jgi:hypothetical protein
MTILRKDSLILVTLYRYEPKAVRLNAYETPESSSPLRRDRKFRQSSILSKFWTKVKFVSEQFWEQDKTGNFVLDHLPPVNFLIWMLRCIYVMTICGNVGESTNIDPSTHCACQLATKTCANQDSRLPWWWGSPVRRDFRVCEKTYRIARRLFSFLNLFYPYFNLNSQTCDFPLRFCKFSRIFSDLFIRIVG